MIGIGDVTLCLERSIRLRRGLHRLAIGFDRVFTIALKIVYLAEPQPGHDGRVQVQTVRPLRDRRAPWLSLTGGSLMIAGYACYLGVAALSAPVLVMAGADGPAPVFARVIDVGQGGASMVWMFVLFVIGNLAGTFLLGLALLRSHAVAAWAAIALLAEGRAAITRNPKVRNTSNELRPPYQALQRTERSLPTV